MKKLAVLTGAGVSAESGIKTFRDEDGLWENYHIEDVCTPEALSRNPKQVLDFYNERRRQLKTVEPNCGHRLLASMEKDFDVSIITQNVDNLHEIAGSTKILHLHGELTKARSIKNPSLIVEVDGDISLGDFAPDGQQLRPHIVFFGEAVPMLERAIPIVEQADILLIAGTSMAVYPAASLYGYARRETPIYVINPNDTAISLQNVFYIKEKFVDGMKTFIKMVKK
jgi:NAD-dependent deacetylase